MPVVIRPCLRAVYSTTAPLGGGLSENVDLVISRPLQVLDFYVVPAAASLGSTATQTRQALGAGLFVALTAASLPCAADGTVTRVTQGFVNAQRTLAVSDVLRATFTDAGPGGAAGQLITSLLPLAIPGNS